LVAASFTGEYPQRIDGKGRMSIPSDFRRVLERNDSGWAEGLNASLFLLYGDHLRDHLQAWSVDAFNEVARGIMALRPRNAEEARRKAVSSRLILGQSVRLEVDRDGRVVMPARQRQKLGLSEGEVVFMGAGDHFEIWAAATFEEKVGAEMRAFLETQPEGFDPMTLVWGAP
jgi:MraZ protein